MLKLLVEGKQMKEVANALNIATRTVAFHKYELWDGSRRITMRIWFVMR